MKIWEFASVKDPRVVVESVVLFPKRITLVALELNPCNPVPPRYTASDVEALKVPALSTITPEEPDKSTPVPPFAADTGVESAIVPDVVIVPPVSPVPAMIEVTPPPPPAPMHAPPIA